jgi:hypothetical protein
MEMAMGSNWGWISMVAGQVNEKSALVIRRRQYFYGIKMR